MGFDLEIFFVKYCDCDAQQRKKIVNDKNNDIKERFAALLAMYNQNDIYSNCCYINDKDSFDRQFEYFAKTIKQTSLITKILSDAKKECEKYNEEFNPLDYKNWEQ